MEAEVTALLRGARMSWAPQKLEEEGKGDPALEAWSCQHPDFSVPAAKAVRDTVLLS